MMKITKKQLKNLINEVAMGGIGPGFHNFNHGRARQRVSSNRQQDSGLKAAAEGRVLKEYSDYASWTDLSDQLDDISEMLDMAADKYVTSAWLFSGENEGNVIANGVAEKLEQLYRDAEALGGLIRGSGALK